MSREFSPRRVILTILFVAWLGVELLVIGISPAWGFVLPHTHITNGVMTAADWEAHEREHRLGINSEILYTSYCDRAGVENKSIVVTSLPDVQGALSLFDLFNATLNATRIAFPTFDANSARLLAHPPANTEIFFPPLHPPPNI